MSLRLNRLVWCALICLTVEAQTVDQIVVRNIAARGGAKRIAALETQSLTGTLGFAPNPGEPFHVEMKRPGKLHQEVSVNHDQFTQVRDEHEGWTLRSGKPGEPMSAAQVKDMSGSADMEGPLFNYKAKGNRVELAGKERIEGRDAYKLIITMKDGTVRTDYIDAQSWLEVKWEGVVGGQKMESYFRDYRKVKGLSCAFAIDSNGANFKQKLVFDRIEINIDLPDARFTKP